MTTYNRWIHRLAPVASALFAAPALSDPGAAGGWGHHGMMGGWFMGPIMMLLWVALIVAIVMLVLRWIGGTGGGTRQGPSSSARQILEERLARGEIDEEEYRKRKQALDE